jgi:hypothetical protein
VAVDGQAIERRRRNAWKHFASVMNDRCTYMSWSSYSTRESQYQSLYAAISRHAVEVIIDMPKPQALTHIGLFGQQAQVEFVEVKGSDKGETVVKSSKRMAHRRSSLLKTVVEPESLSWITSVNLCADRCICARLTMATVG